jgi:hypothetical protein
VRKEGKMRGSEDQKRHLASGMKKKIEKNRRKIEKRPIKKDI